jgi:hypothetical protein
MVYDFKCTNEKCEEFDKLVELNIPYSELDNQVCSCGELLKRVWNSSVGIKTSDGYKS